MIDFIGGLNALFSFCYFKANIFFFSHFVIIRVFVLLRSPMIHHLSESFEGVNNVRAFDAQERFTNKNCLLVDKFHQALIAHFMSQLYMEVYLQLLGAFSIGVIIAIVAVDNFITPGVAAVCLTFSIMMVEEGKVLVLMSAEYEASLNSVERLTEFRDLPQEAAYEIENVCPPGWPNAGHVLIDNISLRYREGLDLVLKDLSLEFEPGEKVGNACIFVYLSVFQYEKCIL